MRLRVHHYYVRLRVTRGLILGRGFVLVPSSFAGKSLGLVVRELKIQSLGFGVRELKSCKNVELYAALR